MGKRVELDKEDLLSKYPEYRNRHGVDIQRWSMFPIGVKSDHMGKQVTFTKHGAESIIKKINGMPVMYADGDTIPSTHRDSSGNRKAVGTTIGGGIYTDEIGTEWAYADTIIYTDTERDVYANIIKFKDSLATSIEANIAVDDEFNIHDADYEGLSILSNTNSAWQTRALVADKGEIEIKYDDVIKQVIGADYAAKLNEKDQLLNDTKTQFETQLAELTEKLNEREELIDGLNTENTVLRQLNTKFSSLIK